MTPNDLGFLTAKEAAALLRCSVDNVRALIKSGELKGRVVGGKYQTTVDALRELLSTPRTTPVVVLARKPRAALPASDAAPVIDLRRKRKGLAV